MTTSVIVIVADRAAHLDQLIAGIERGERLPDEVVIVDMASADDPRSVVRRRSRSVPVVWVDVPQVSQGRLPLAAARNAGAASAAGDHLIFCDVDCIPDRHLVGAYDDAIERGGLVCGPVRYLERFWMAGLDLGHPDIDDDLWVRSAPSPARPVVGVESVDDRHELFWSVAFGLDKNTWARIGGFDEGYVGYGAEDTDFGFTARALDISLRWTTSGVAYHQWHRGADQPVEHLAAIVDNARRFRLRWGRWPMEGWLGDMQRGSHVVWNPSSTELRAAPGAPALARPLRVVSIPASHPYTRRVVPDDVDVAADPTDPWWPHVALTPEWIDAEHRHLDLAHLHFGYEHRTPAELDRWCQALDEFDVGLVVTVHDLHNPHLLDNSRHERHLDTLMRRADEVITLTAGAAEEIERRWNRRPRVIAHPHVAPLDWRDRFSRRRPCGGPALVGVNFSSFRANMLTSDTLLEGLAVGACDAGARLVVRADAGASRQALHRLAASADRAGAQVEVSDRPGDGALLSRVVDLDVVVLPYAFGTHSGMVELCHDLGSRVLVPDVGYYRDQWADVETFRLGDDGQADPDVVRAALGAALARNEPTPAARSWREDQRRQIVAAHAAAYRAVARR